MNGLRVELPDNGIALLVLDRPEKLNSLDHALFVALADTLDQIARDDSVHVLILTGEGRGFCAGADILGSPPPFDKAGATEWMRQVQRGPLALVRLPQPSIAVVNGPAAGGGVGLALASDIRIASPTATFSVPFVRMGLGPDFGTSKTLPQIVGTSTAMRMLLTGNTVTADEALATGLVSQISSEPMHDALTLAAQIAAQPPEATRRIKALVRDAAGTDLETVVEDLEPHYQAEGISDPRFRDRMMRWMQDKGTSQKAT